jgi:hypothetical protein
MEDYIQLQEPRWHISKQKMNELTHVLSCLTKLEKLLCLKCAGSSVCEKTKGSATTKLLLPLPQAMTPSVPGSSAIMYVFETKGAAMDLTG